MKTKIEIQNNLIDAIVYWNAKGKTLGYSKAQELINEYERQVKLFAIPDVSGSTLDFVKELPKLQQCQASLKYQLMILRVAANKLGLYDAADFIKRD